mgnify:CR=1 FL=1
MRSSGAHADTLLYAVPIVVLMVVAITNLGGLQETAQLVNDTIIDALYWVMRLV